MTKFYRNVDFGAVQKFANLVDIEKSTTSKNAAKQISSNILDTKIGFDTAENEPFKMRVIFSFLRPLSHSKAPVGEP